MSSNRLAIITLVLGLAAGAIVGSLLDPLGRASGPNVVRAAAPVGGPLVPTVNDAKRAAPSVGEATLSAVSAGPSAAPSAPADVDERTARALSERAVASLDASPSEDEAAWTARIRGIVVDEDGAPIAGATVYSGNNDSSRQRSRGESSKDVGRAWRGFDALEDAVANSAKSTLAARRVARIATTGADGRFELERLRPGAHYLQAYAEGLVFDGVRTQTGDPARIVGKRVCEFHLDVRLPDGTAPEEALVTVGDERRRNNLIWTPTEPVLRMSTPTAQLEVLAGNTTSLDYQTYSSEYKSVSRTIDLARDGAGPHVFDLTARTILRVTVDDTSTIEPRMPVWVQAVSAAQVKGRDLASAFEDGTKLSRVEGQRYDVPDLAPGRYIVGAGRGKGAPEVTATVELGAGITEAALQLPEIDLSRFLIVRCKSPEGRPLAGVSISCSVESGNGSRSGGISTSERPDGEYWLSLGDILKGVEWTKDVHVRLTATSRGYGQLDVEVPTNASELNLDFEPACDLIVQVSGDLSAGFSVQLSAVAEGNDPEAMMRRMNRGGNKLVRVDGEGRAVLAGLQPGPIEVQLVQTTERYFWGEPTLTQEITLRPGSQTINLSAPALYEVLVHAPDLEVGTHIQLSPVSGARSPFGGEGVETDADHRARFKKVVAGEYRLQSWGGVSGQMKITVPCGEVLFAPEQPNALEVTGIVAGKAAAQAGLQNGDVIVAISGREIESDSAMQRLYLDMQDAAVTVDFLRGGTRMQATLGPFKGQRAWSELGASFAPVRR
ncbi:MAG: PDZ domain-containing protein [Planctomycetota bacterium]